MGRQQGGGVRGGVGWGAEGGFFHTLKQKSDHCVLMEIQRGAQYTYQAKKVIGSIFIPNVALLVYVCVYTYMHVCVCVCIYICIHTYNITDMHAYYLSTYVLM